jgi:putative hydrolase of HD superfamily
MLEADHNGGSCEQDSSSEDAGTTESAAIQFAELVGRLKTTPRTGWVRRGVPKYESVADHSWRVAVLSLLVGGNGTVNVGKCMQLALVHDLAECIVGDIAPGDNISKRDKQRMEHEAMTEIIQKLQKATGPSDGTNSPAAQRLQELFHEYEARKTKEAIAVKDLDLLDMLIQAREYEEQFGIDLSEFFDGTPTSRFQTTEIRNIAKEVHRQQKNRSENTRMNEISDGYSKTDTAFISEYATTSSIEVSVVAQVVKALRKWEQTR